MLACIALVVCATAPAAAYVRSLSPVLERQAAARGRGAALAHEGLPAAGYIAYQRGDGLHIAAGQGSVDAVVVGTPYERVLYLLYEDTFVGATPPATALAHAKDPGSIDLMVFAHSRDPADQSFLHRFRAASLRIGSSLVRPSRTSIAGVTQDFFTTPGGRVFLWLGAVTFRFPVPSTDARSKGRFSFVDAYGRAYAVGLDFGAYR